MDRSTKVTLSTYNTWVQLSRVQTSYRAHRVWSWSGVGAWRGHLFALVVTPCPLFRKQRKEHIFLKRKGLGFLTGETLNMVEVLFLFVFVLFTIFK